MPINGRGVNQAVDAADSESSLTLLERARGGDLEARDRLCARYLPRLTRWAKGRLPAGARDLTDTSDLVQETLLQSIKRIDAFHPNGEGSWQAYLRQALLNRIRQECRRAGRKPRGLALEDEHVDPGRSALDEAIGREMVESYESALSRLKESDREAVIARVELGFSYEEVALATGRPSAEAARTAVTRALLRIAADMRR